MIITKIKSSLALISKSNSFKIFSLGFLLVIITFPLFDFSFNIGIDPPLAWVFNYLFANDLKLGQYIIFPHGPLAFLMYPTYQNALLGIAIKILLQVTLVYSIAILLKEYKNTIWLILFAISFFLLKLLPLNHLIILIVLTSYLNYFETKQLHFKIISVLLTAFAIYIKAYVAIMAGTITFSFLIIEYRQFKDWKKAAFTMGLGVIAVFAIWLTMYKTFSGVITYFIGMLNLAQDNSAAAAAYPKNNWLYLLGFLLITSLTPFIQKDKRGVLFASLFLFSFFGAWKHGIAREDILHMNGLFRYALSSMIIFVVYIRKNYFLNIFLITIAFSLFYLNLTNISGYKSASLELTGVVNFKNTISDFSSVVERSQKRTNQNIAKRKLPERIIKEIGNNTVDVYPWDYSIIAANNLNWQPRVVIQSYAAYTSWLDKQNAKHFIAEKAPTFILWHIEGATKTLGDLNSIDKRYLLNDEPFTILEILKNYKLVEKTSSVLVYKKRESRLTLSSTIIKTEVGSWNKWIEVPDANKHILRLKTDIKGNINRKIKSFFYKDEAFYIYYRLFDGSIVSKKFVPKNACDGIWINPFIQSPMSSRCEKNVKQIMIKCSNPKLLKQEIPLEWESISFNQEKDNPENYVNTFFAKSAICVDLDSLLLESTNSFEGTMPFWNLKPDLCTNAIYLSGKKALKLDANRSSPSFEYNIDSLPLGKLKVMVDAFIYAEQKDEASLIISIEDEYGFILWEAEFASRFIIDNNAWNYMQHEVRFNNTHQKNAKLKIYFWNTGDKYLIVDDMSVKINKIIE